MTTYLVGTSTQDLTQLYSGVGEWEWREHDENGNEVWQVTTDNATELERLMNADNSVVWFEDRNDTFTGYSISEDKINAVLATDTAKQHDLTYKQIEDFCTADWPEGLEHQLWLESASPDAIAEWIVAGQS